MAGSNIDAILGLELAHTDKYVRYPEIESYHGKIVITLFIDRMHGESCEDVDDFIQALIDHGSRFVASGQVGVFLIDCKCDDLEDEKQIYIELVENSVVICTER